MGNNEQATNVGETKGYEAIFILRMVRVGTGPGKIV